MRKYNRDPHWLEARFDGKCSGKACGKPIKKGEQAFYYPNSKSILGSVSCDCGNQAARDFEAARFDEGGF